MVWSYENAFCVQRLQKQGLYSTISSLPCQSSPCVQESTTTHACGAADAGTRCAAPCLQAEEDACWTWNGLQKHVWRFRQRGWSYLFERWTKRDGRSTSERQLLYQQHCTHASWYCVTKTDKEENTFLKNKFVFFAHRKYSCSFIKLRLLHWRDMDYFNNILTIFLGLKRGCVAVYAGSERSWIS